MASTVRDADIPKLTIYGFSGKIGSGKDYVAKEILPHILVGSGRHSSDDSVIYLAFADFLKSVCAARFGLKYNDLYERKTAETRKRLQYVGDEIRDMYGDMYFVNSMELEVTKHLRRSNIKTFVITDVRYPEEVAWIRKMGGYIIRIKAPERSKKKLMEECKENVDIYKKRSEHPSETLLDNADFNLVINNDPDDNPWGELSDWIAQLL